MANWWCIIFTSFALLIPILIMKKLIARLIYLGCVVALTVLYFCIKLHKLETVSENNAQEFQLPELRRGESESTSGGNASTSGGNAWSVRRWHYPEMSFETREEIANWAIRSLPPVKSYEGQDIVYDCPICMEEFERGNSVQSFGVCGHEFHHACLNSWLQRGKSTCPVCRLDLFV